MFQFIIFIFGTAMGSAANALIDRLPRKESWFKGRSKCDRCGHKLEGRDLIPVFSYLTLGGKCRYCHSPIPVRNLIVELIMGTAFMVINYHAFTPGNLLLSLMAWATVIIAVTDRETKLVPEALVILWGILVIAHQLLISNANFLNPDNISGILAGAGLIGGIWLVTRGRAMGEGDIEIAAVMGWWLGGGKTIAALWLAFVLGSIISLWQMARGRAKLKSEIAFGPFLITGCWAAFFWGNRFWELMGFR